MSPDPSMERGGWFSSGVVGGVEERRSAVEGREAEDGEMMVVGRGWCVWEVGSGL